MSVDYLLGRRVLSIDDPGGGDDWDWSITLEGDAAIHYTGDDDKPDPTIVDSVLGSATLESEVWSLEFYKGAPAELVAEVRMIEDAVEIQWPPGHTEMRPVEIDPTKDLPPDLSSERFRDGPLNGN